MATKENEEIVYEKKWYIIHTYSGYEKKVATDLEKRIETLNLTDRVFRILVPEEEVLEEESSKEKKKGFTLPSFGLKHNSVKNGGKLPPN